MGKPFTTSAVVRFTRGYCLEAYGRFIGALSVLVLSYREHEVGAHVVIMKHLGAAEISAGLFKGAEEGKRIEPLHSRGLAFADLREQTVLME